MFAKIWESIPEDLRTEILTCIGILFLALLVALICFFKWLKARAQYKILQEETALNELKLKNDNAILQRKLLNGSYTICPKCNETLLLTDLVFHNDVGGVDNGNAKKIDSKG